MRKPFNAKGAARKALVKAGWAMVEDGERWQGGYKFDFQGFGDLVCYDPRWGWMMVQATVDDHLSKHIKKAWAEPNVARWIGWGFRAEIWSYPARADRDDGEMEPTIINMKSKGG